MVSEPAAFVLWLGTLTSHTGIKEGSPPTGHALPLFGIRAILFWPLVVLLCFSVSLFVSTRNFGTQLLCPLLTVVGATLVVK